MTDAEFLDERYPDRPAALRARWRKQSYEQWLRRKEQDHSGAA